MSSTASPLEKRRARIRQIRASVAAGAVAVFVGILGFLFGQLSSGSDPALSDNASTSTATTTTSQNTASSDESEDDGSVVPSAASSPSSSQTWSAPAPAPVQTGQS